MTDFQTIQLEMQRMFTMNFLLLLCFYLRWVLSGSLPASQLAEQTLIAALINSNTYNKNVRPEFQVTVELTAQIQQIVSIDEKQQIMTSSSFISQSWTDDRLSWTPNATNNFTQVIMLPVKNLWIPDTMIINSADTSGYLTVSDFSYASVQYTGDIYMILPALTIKTRCNMFVQKFPFDKQICTINLTSWSQGANRIFYVENSTSVIDTTNYKQHPMWTLTRTDMVVIQGEDRAPFDNDYNTVISIQLFLQRQPLYFMVNGIFACLVLNCVTLLAYALPFGNQITLCMTCFMTYSVYSLNFSNLFPQQSEYLMLITLYFLLSICWTLLSMGWFVLCNHFITNKEIPKILDKFGSCLQRLFCCCFSANKEDGKTNGSKANDESAKINTENVDKVTKEEKKCIYCQQLFGSCFGKTTRIENIDSKNQLVIEDIQEKKSTSAVALISTDEKSKVKCDFCNRCDSCQTEYDKDKAKEKKKKHIEAQCSALNYFIFIFILVFMFISNMVLWLTMAQ